MFYPLIATLPLGPTIVYVSLKYVKAINPHGFAGPYGSRGAPVIDCVIAGFQSDRSRLIEIGEHYPFCWLTLYKRPNNWFTFLDRIYSRWFW